ncbi:MAG: alcohol dehydrogenase catalytic domain-containing protein [Bryobacterales bacterium]|nr:alcohol dehydrogenase catalytic domain-containing protein [Bryobacterales bacterium]
MRAAYYAGKETIHVGDCVPEAPGAGQVQIRVSHCGICGTDLHVWHGHMDHRVKTPQVIGHEMSGTIEAVGEGVSGWSAGDRVTVMPLDPCGECAACKAGHGHVCMKLKFIGIDVPGALQTLWTVPAHTLHRIPDSLTLEHAALIEPVAVACHDVRLGEVKAGEYAVVLGGGPIGTLVALVAKQAGARVLVSEVNPFRIELARKLGLDVVDPKEIDLIQHVWAETGGTGADVVFEVTGNAASAEVMTELPRVRGRIVIVGVFAKPVPVNLHKFFWRELKLCGARVYEHQDFEKAIELAASRALPFDGLITDVYALDRLGEGLQQMEKGGAVMKILVECK